MPSKKVVATKRAKKGAELLDKAWRGWHKKIKVTRLDVDDVYCCVLGQLSADYYEGQDELGKRVEQVRKWSLDNFVAHGFDTRDHEATNEFIGYLNEAWREEIRARKAPKVSA